MSLANATDCSAASDRSFGPVVADCVRKFDFTLTFEESILAILPSAILILLAPIRLLSLRSRRRSLGGRAVRIVKLVAILALAIVQTAVLALWAQQSIYKTHVSLAAAALYVVDAIVFAILSYVEHAASPSPSLLLNAYLTLSIIFDAVRTRTLWTIGHESSVLVPFTVALGLKILILLMEECSKSRYMAPQDDHGLPAASEVTAGVFSRTLFWWLNRLLRAGFSHVLTVNELPPVDTKLLSDSLWSSFDTRWNPGLDNNSASLLVTLFATLKGPFLAPLVPRLCLLALALTQPFLINAFMKFLSSPDDGTQHQKNVGYGLVGAYGLVYVCIAIMTAWAQQSVYRFVTMVRGCLVAVIYRKTVDLSIVGLDDATAVTLMSTDVERIVQGFATIHETWATILQIGIALFLLSRAVGNVFIVPLLMFIVCGVAVGALGGQAGAKQAGWMKAIEKRVGATSSMLGSVKAVKFSGLSGTLSANVQALRLMEIASARMYRIMLIWVVLISYIPSSITPVVLFAAYTALASKNHEVLDSTRIFTSLSLLSLITEPLTQLFQVLPELLAAVACVGRIQKFLLSPARGDKRESPLASDTPVNSVYALSTEDQVSEAVQTEKDSAKVSDLTNRSRLSQNALTIADGTFGWSEDGKPVLKGINISIAPSSLTMVIGKVGCGKSTLLNTLLGETSVVHGCVTLSSSNMSFCDQTPWLTNQTLQANIVGFSKYDSKWYAAVLHACALEADLAQLPDRDQVMVGSKGITLSGGQKQRVAIARAVYSRRSVAIFDDVFSGLDTHTQKHVFDNVFGRRGLLRAQKTTVVLATHAVYLLPFADNIIALGEDGCIAAQGKFDELNQLDGYLLRFGLEKSQDDDSWETSSAPSIFPPDSAKIVPIAPVAPSSVPKTVDDTSRRLGDRSVYRYYFETIGLANTLLFFGLLLVWVVALKFPEIWLKWWGDSNVRHPGAENGKYLGVYAVFQVASLAALGLNGRHLLLVLVVASGKGLHYVLLRAVTCAPLSFFAVTDTGSIANLFSQDIQLIDAELPIAFLNVTCNIFVCIAQAIMILPTSYWLTLTYPFLVGVVYLVQKFYLRTSRQLRLLDLEAKSPLYSQFLETLNGLATIRAFSWQDKLVAQNEERLDRSQKPFYLLYSIQRWLNLVLDLIAAALALIVTGVAVATRNKTSAGFAGVALFNIMTLSGAMKAAVNVWTVLETSIGAVARVKLFEETTPSEHLASESQTPPESWPESGALTFNGVSAFYKSGNVPALDDVSLRIKAGEKIGICGRSGSGKSSLLLSLLRMLELGKGSITIDGVDVANVPRELVRERLTTIPQDPFIFSGTVRQNCDPRGTSSDEQIIQALENVQVLDIIESKGGLDAEMTQDFLSHGQKQLFCLVRAILHPSKIIVIDEATSSVDVDTDKIVQKVMRTAFKDATVIVVAHRLETILDFDTVVVIEGGRIVEKDSPVQLLAWPSAFKELYEIYKGCAAHKEA